MRLRGRWLLALASAACVVVVAGAAPAVVSAGPQPTHGWSAVPVGVRGAVSAALGRDDARYRVQRSGDELAARNPAQGLRVRFVAGGVRVSSGGGELGLRIAGATRANVSANRVVYRRPGVREWFANGPLGLEQGFTLARPQPLVLRLSGALARKARLGPNSVTFGSLVYRDLVVSDATGRRLPARFALSGRRLRILIRARRARYPLRVDPVLQEVAELTASDNPFPADLGTSIAVDGDTIVAGAPGVAVGGRDQQGAVYVFVKPNDGWANATEAAKLTASDGAAGDDLGGSVAISGDTIVAGTGYAEVGGHALQGAAYVFVKPNGGWVDATQTAKLTASDGVGDAFFGDSVSIDGDTIAVGAPDQQVGSNYEQGEVYVFVKPDGGWTDATETAKLTASDGAASDHLGNSVAISGGTVAAGAPFASSHDGVVYVFEKQEAGWANESQAAELTASDAVSGDQLGSAVAVDGGTVVAGAPFATVGVNSSQGAAYVFVEPNGGWANATQTAKLTSSDGAEADAFGTGVAIAGDTIAVGAPDASPNARTNQGAEYVFVKPADGWVTATETGELDLSGNEPADYLGEAVGIAGNAVVGGAPNAAIGNGGSREGAVFVFDDTTLFPTAPTAPRTVTAVRGNAQATVSWSAPASDGNATITGYTVTSTPGGKHCTWTSGPLHCTVTGLTNGTAYTFKVTATNSVGTGSASAASNSVTPATVPGAPAAPTATRGNVQATVSWSAPASNGGAAITGYTVTSTPGGKHCAWTSGPLHCTVTGLTNGTVYTFKVTATNGVGTGNASAASNSVTPAGVPGAPSGAKATAADAQATVSWTAPASNGGAAITGYTVTASPGGKTCAWTSGPLQCTVTGLTDGTAYTFTVTARNVVGTGSASHVSNSVTPAGVPGAPTHVSGTAQYKMVLVSWSAPASNGGAAITRYTVTASPGGNTCSWTSGPLQCTVNGLVNGTNYTFTVTATNRVGLGAASAPSPAVAPIDVKYLLTVVKQGNGSGKVASTLFAINCGKACHYNYGAGTVVTLVATPASGSTFAGWSGSGCSGTGDCVIAMNAVHTVTATFTKNALRSRPRLGRRAKRV